MKVKEPKWGELCSLMNHENSKGNLRNWFALNVAPFELYDPKAAEEVFTKGTIGIDNEDVWSKRGSDNAKYHNKYAIRKALLINIELIKRETAEDVLKDLLEHATLNDVQFADLVDRASNVLQHQGNSIREKE